MFLVNKLFDTHLGQPGAHKLYDKWPTPSKLIFLVQNFSSIFIKKEKEKLQYNLHSIRSRFSREINAGHGLTYPRFRSSCVESPSSDHLCLAPTLCLPPSLPILNPTSPTYPRGKNPPTYPRAKNPPRVSSKQRKKKHHVTWNTKQDPLYNHVAFLCGSQKPKSGERQRSFITNLLAAPPSNQKRKRAQKISQPKIKKHAQHHHVAGSRRPPPVTSPLSGQRQSSWRNRTREALYRRHAPKVLRRVRTVATETLRAHQLGVGPGGLPHHGHDLRRPGTRLEVLPGWLRGGEGRLWAGTGFLGMGREHWEHDGV